MDRYGEIYTTYDFIVKGAAQAKDALILANGDSPIFNSVETVNPRKYYGFAHSNDEDLLAHYNTEGILCPNCQSILHYHSQTYANLGDYFCPTCGFSRPKLDAEVTRMIEQKASSSKFEIDGFPVNIEIGGLYNVYNALAAASVAKHYGVGQESIQKGLAAGEAVFGRQETFSIGGKHCTLVLVKNPVGTNQVIDMIGLTKGDFTLVSLLNANYADGIDTSWIWDANYEHFSQMNVSKVIAGGVRHAEMGRRLRVAGIPTECITEVEDDFEELVEEIKNSTSDQVFILATYTAVLNLRKHLAEKKIIKGGM
jgi:UDP-N-acetylmuramoyl-L-alanyl-D-glutamate--2,6-diaminopimelate ligase